MAILCGVLFNFGVTVITSIASGYLIALPLMNELFYMAETKRFELLKAIKPYLVSSEAHSTGLCDVSELRMKFTAFQPVLLTH